MFPEQIKKMNEQGKALAAWVLNDIASSSGARVNKEIIYWDIENKQEVSPFTPYAIKIRPRLSKQNSLSSSIADYHIDVYSDELIGEGGIGSVKKQLGTFSWDAANQVFHFTEGESWKPRINKTAKATDANKSAALLEQQLAMGGKKAIYDPLHNNLHNTMRYFSGMTLFDKPTYNFLTDRTKNYKNNYRIDFDKNRDTLFFIHTNLRILREVHKFHTNQQYVHGDLKPENIIILPNGTVKLIDYGMAAPMNSKWQGRGGTPGYLAPIDISGLYQKTYNANTPSIDIYALGAILLEQLLQQPLPIVERNDSNPGTNAGSVEVNRIIQEREKHIITIQRNFTLDENQATELFNSCIEMLSPNPQKQPKLSTVIANFEKIQRQKTFGIKMSDEEKPAYERGKAVRQTLNTLKKDHIAPNSLADFKRIVNAQLDYCDNHSAFFLGFDQPGYQDKKAFLDKIALTEKTFLAYLEMSELIRRQHQADYESHPYFMISKINFNHATQEKRQRSIISLDQMEEEIARFQYVFDTYALPEHKQALSEKISTLTSQTEATIENRITTNESIVPISTSTPVAAPSLKQSREHENIIDVSAAIGAVVGGILGITITVLTGGLGYLFLPGCVLGGAALGGGIGAAASKFKQWKENKKEGVVKDTLATSTSETMETSTADARHSTQKLFQQLNVSNLTISSAQNTPRVENTQRLRSAQDTPRVFENTQRGSAQDTPRVLENTQRGSAQDTPRTSISSTNSLFAANRNPSKRANSNISVISPSCTPRK